MAIIHRVGDTVKSELFEGASCAFGVFDGVHRGHQFLIDCAKDTAFESAGKSIALTFDKDPDEVFRPEKLKKLMTNEERLRALSSTGVDIVAVLPFTREFAASSPDEFLEKTFNGFPPAHLHVGYDFRFGVKASGDVCDLKEWGRDVNSCIHAHELKSLDGDAITATRIRGLLAQTDIQAANKLLGHPYYVTGVVQPGRGEGEDLGFRTANLVLSDQIQALGDGVYACYATVDDTRYKAAVSVGVSPVFEGKTQATCEAHLIDFSGDLYGKEIKIEFVYLLRPMIRFESVEELIATVQSNIAWTKANL